MSVQDSTGLRDTQSTLASTTNVLTLRALEVTTGGLNFGSLHVGEDTGVVNATTTTRNTGNVPMDVQLAGSSTISTPIPVNTQKYATSTFIYASCSICQFLSGAATPVKVTISKPTSTTTAQQHDIYFGISIPNGTPAGTLTGTNEFDAVAPGG
jgi:hypothetical protein